MTQIGGRLYAWRVLALRGIVFVGMGVYFITIRPPLLPEDHRAIGTSLAQIRGVAPGIERWLQKVFWVMGGYITATGLLLVHFAVTAFRERATGAFVVAFAAGAFSIGVMTAINFAIASDFQWLLLGFGGLWILSLLLYGMKR